MKSAGEQNKKKRIPNAVEYSFNGVEKEKWITDTRPVCRELLGKLGIGGWEVAVLFCDDCLMTRLNAEYRQKKGPTDVLAFRQEDDDRFPENPDAPKTVGDIVISVDTLLRNSETHGIDPTVELVRLLIHAMLHLNGMDHDDNDKTMLDLQEKLLAELGYGNI
jgi:probable rRNA maturation factor